MRGVSTFGTMRRLSSPHDRPNRTALFFGCAAPHALHHVPSPAWPLHAAAPAQNGARKCSLRPLDAVASDGISRPALVGDDLPPCREDLTRARCACRVRWCQKGAGEATDPVAPRQTWKDWRPRTEQKNHGCRVSRQLDAVAAWPERPQLASPAGNP